MSKSINCSTVGKPRLKSRANKIWDYKERISYPDANKYGSIFAKSSTRGIATSSYFAATNREAIAFVVKCVFYIFGEREIRWKILSARNIVYLLNEYLVENERISWRHFIRTSLSIFGCPSINGKGRLVYCRKRCSLIFSKYIDASPAIILLWES
jgi:hypothetical protein